MPTSNIEVIEIGIPGPPGAGVTAAEKATFVTTSAANVFTAAQEIRASGAPFFVSDGAATTDRIFMVSAAVNRIYALNGADLAGYSDYASTETWSIDGPTGNAQFDGTVTASRIVGDTTVFRYVFDGGGVVLTTGVKMDDVVPFNCVVNQWTLFGDQTGSAVVDIWQDTYANSPPTVADTITTGEKPTLSSVQKNQDTSLNGGAGWALTQDRTLRFNLDSVTTCTRLTLALKVTRT